MEEENLRQALGDRQVKTEGEQDRQGEREKAIQTGTFRQEAQQTERRETGRREI